MPEHNKEYWLQRAVDFIIAKGLVGVKLPETKTPEEAKAFYHRLVKMHDGCRAAADALDNFDGREIR